MEITTVSIHVGIGVVHSVAGTVVIAVNGTGATKTPVGTTEIVAITMIVESDEIVAIKFNGTYVIIEAGAITGLNHVSGKVIVLGND